MRSCGTNVALMELRAPLEDHRSERAHSSRRTLVAFATDQSLYAANSSSSALASFRSRVSKPSVNQL